MSIEKTEKLRALLAKHAQTLAVVEAVLAVWPEHAAYLAKNFALRSTAMLDTTEAQAHGRSGSTFRRGLSLDL
jgi:hypothetical protein